nr:HEAT repeat domain-containing protein [Cytophagales bacterium]
MEQEIDDLMRKFLDKDESDPYRFGDKLAKIGSPEVREKLIAVVKGGDLDNAFLAAKILGKMEDNAEGLNAVLEVIHSPANRGKNGGLVSLLEDFDLSEKFVDIFRIYLFGNFKAYSLAKEYLDYTEFTITPRTLKKAEKHLNHFLNNAGNEEWFELKKQEAEAILREVVELLSKD